MQVEGMRVKIGKEIRGGVEIGAVLVLPLAVEQK